ncbi:hypothetical protein DWB58_11610 [candidate division KSB1 bacterium]|nr:hypothetical protein [candidate division KSB1 bacterium]
MFMNEKKTGWQSRAGESKRENRELSSRIRLSRDRRSAFAHPHGLIALAIVALLTVGFPASGRAQQNTYYHTMHSNSLALQYGRTAKLDYSYQMSRRQQFKLTALFVNDKFDLGRDEVRSKVYNMNLRFQYNLLHLDRLFINGSLGAGAYHLRAKNLLDQEHNETKINFVGGFQGEYFISGSSLALVFDYDFLYLRFSDLYEFVHIPAVGLALVF